MRSATFTPSCFDRYSTNGVQRSVTPDSFSAGTTAKVSSGYLAFQSSAEAEDVNASTAAPARTSLRVIMIPSSSVGSVDAKIVTTGAAQAAAAVPSAAGIPSGTGAGVPPM